MEADVETMLRRLLRPLIAYLMRRGVGYIALRDLLKKIFVEQALNSQSGDDAPTDSMISLVTGINRREVKRLREEAIRAQPTSGRDAMAGVNLVARVVATWLSSKEFQDAAGIPCTLATRATEAGPNFDALLRAAKVDVRARTVVGELERTGTVDRDADGRLRLLVSSYTPDSPREKMLFLAANISDHMRSALHNLSSVDEPFIERALFHNAISAADLIAVRPALAEMADKMLRHANEKLMENSLSGTDSQRDTESGNRRRMRLGVYYFETDSDDRP